MPKSVTQQFDPSKMTVSSTVEAFESIKSKRGERPKSEFRKWLESLEIGQVVEIDDAEHAKTYRSAAIQVARNAGLGIETKINGNGNVVIHRVATEEEQAQLAQQEAAPKGRRRSS